MKAGDSGRCPINETRVVMVKNQGAIFEPPYYYVNSWDATSLLKDIINVCVYNLGYKINSNYAATGYHLDWDYIDGFDSVPSSSSNSQLNLSI